jgi:hypothetical protein
MPPDGNRKRRHLAAKGPFRSLLFAQFLTITQSVQGASGYDSPQCNGAGDRL